MLGVRDGFEKPTNQDLTKKPPNERSVGKNHDVDLNEDEDISDYLEIESSSGKAFVEMKKVERDFSVRDFVSGAKKAYEMILMAYEKGDLVLLEQYLSEDVFGEFEKVVMERADKGYIVEASFLGIREIRIKNAVFNINEKEAEITVFFKCEMSSVVKDKEDNVLEGSLSKVKTHTDVWTFGRKIGSSDPSWRLIATGE